MGGSARLKNMNIIFWKMNSLGIRSVVMIYPRKTNIYRHINIDACIHAYRALQKVLTHSFSIYFEGCATAHV